MATPPSFTAGNALTAAQMNSIGAWLLGTYTASGTSTDLNLTSVFTSDFADYLIVGEGMLSSSGYENLRVRLMSGSTVATGGDYYYGVTYVTWTGVTGVNNGNAFTFFVLGNVNTSATATSGFTCTVTRPQEAQKTSFHYSMQGSDAGWCGNTLHNLATSYDGLRIYLGAGNITGTVRVYGYRK